MMKVHCITLVPHIALIFVSLFCEAKIATSFPRRAKSWQEQVSASNRDAAMSSDVIRLSMIPEPSRCLSRTWPQKLALVSIKKEP